MQIELIETKKLIPYENNPRINDDAVDNVANSIKEFGFQQPIVVDKNMVVIVGHTRLKAAKKLKLKKVPVQIADLSEEQANAYRLADNKVGEVAEWDIDKLNEELDKIFDIDMTDFGFNLFDDDEEEENTEIKEDEAPEPPEEPKAKAGDLYILGNHRLICGDSTDIAVIDRLMDGVKADMVFTDPPYNVAMKRSATIQNDDLSQEEFENLLDASFFNAKDKCKTNNMYWWIGFRQYSTLEKIFNKYNVDVRNCIVWDKGSIGLGKKGYRYQHELCIFSGEINNNSASDVWQFNRSTEGIHPTMKPIALVAYAIKNIDKADTVLDLFGGSGSTLIACEQLNRKCFMAELDPKYVSVIVNRWLKFTGRKDEIFCIRDGQKLTYDEIFN